MTYLKVAIAAIQRYRIEKPYRELFAKRFPKRRQTIPFGQLIDFLIKRRVIKKAERKKIMVRYTELSRTLHGNTL